MTQATSVKPAVEVQTCASCPCFDDFQEHNGRGWCKLFDHNCRKQHEQTQDCINSSDLEVSHELKDNLEFFPEVKEKFVEPVEAKAVKPKPILRRNQHKKVFQISVEEERYTVIKVWDNGGTWLGSRVESVLIRPCNSRQKPWWESVIKSQQIEQGDTLKRGLGEYLVKA